jgi:hypothetical protein
MLVDVVQVVSDGMAGFHITLLLKMLQRTEISPNDGGPAHFIIINVRPGVRWRL